MRRVIVISIMAVALSARAQAATGTGKSSVTGGGTMTVQGSGQLNARQSSQPNQQRENIPQNTSGSANAGNYPAVRGNNDTNNFQTHPFQTFTNPVLTEETNGIQYGRTNQYSRLGTNATAFGMTPANANISGTNSPTYSASMTNTLSTMSPQQAQSVVGIQTSLNALQQAAIHSGGAGQNSQIQTQLQNVETQINHLAQGQVKPSDETVRRLTRDLLRADQHSQLTENQQLVLATAINQIANSETMTVFQIENAINAAEANLEGAGAPRWVSFSVGADLRAMALELQPNLQLQ